VPEIEMPGHSLAAIKAYPELGNRMQVLAQGGNAKPLETWDNVFNVEDSTIRFLKDVMDEVLELFPSKFIHIGGDEVDKSPWKLNKRAQDRMKAEGLKDEHELQSWFIRQFDTYLASKGRRLIGWDEILEGGLAPGAAVMSWRGVSGGIDAAKAGHDVVMSPTSHAYFDYYQSRAKEKEPKAIGGFLPLQMVYSFEPVPAELTAEEAKHVLGGQANLWSEFIPHPKHMEYMAYPRLCAMAEVVWSPREKRSWDDFLGRLTGAHLERLRVLDVNFRAIDPPGPPPVGTWRSGEVSERYEVREWPLSLTGAGEYSVTFAYTGGLCRLDIEWAEVLEDGKVIARDTHFGRTGGDDKDNQYSFKVASVKPGSRYILRAHIRSDGGTDSNGEIYLTKKTT
jgi:hexosaminidase